MIGYIVVQDYHYEGNWQHPNGGPSKLILDRAEAEAEAKTLSGLGTSGDVWEVDLSALPPEALAALP